MALLSVFTIIRALSLFHLTLAYLFLTAPKMVADQNMVYILGEAMQLPHVTTLDKPSETSAFIAVILAFLGIADLTAASLNEAVSLEYWLSNAPIRLVFLFGLSGYVYFFKQNGLLAGSKSLLRSQSPGALLQNSLVFSFAFVETAMWFWIFTSLRDERRQQAIRRLEKRKAEEDRL